MSRNRNVGLALELEARLSWAPYDGAGMEDLWAEFEVSPEALRDAANSLRDDLIRLPVRVGYKDSPEPVPKETGPSSL